MSGSAAAVVLMPLDPDGSELESVVGAGRAHELAALLAGGAEAWARETAFDSVAEAGRGESLSDAAARVFADRDGPLLVVWPVLPQLRAEHASAALGDLDAGCDVVLGPIIDGGLYLLGLARPLPELLSLPTERWQDSNVMTIALSAVTETGLEVGILRAEPALRRTADVRAALADPLLPPEVRRILGSR